LVVASGSLDIIEEAPETMWVRIDPRGGGCYHGAVSLDAVGGVNVFHKSWEPPYFNHAGFEFLAPLSPGQYTLTWSAQGQLGISNLWGGFDFTMGVPEPSGLLLLTAAGVPLFMRRRGRQR
jgi:hypothetical protein